MEDKISFTFVGQIIPQELLNHYFNELEAEVDIAGNTFYTTLLDGIVESGYSVEAYSRIKNTIIQHTGDAKEGVQYVFLPYVENNFQRYLDLLKTGFRQIKEFKKRCKREGKRGYAVFNVLRISSSVGGMLASKIYHVKTIGVVTDVPGYRLCQDRRSYISFFADKIGQFLMKQFDSYVLLSKDMERAIGVNGRPSVIIEGIYQDKSTNEHLEKRITDKFEIVYAGSLHYQYGIMNLVDAIRTIKDERICLKIFGQGEASGQIQNIARQDKKIYFGGLIARDELLKIEREASLLVNPRPVEDTYVRYSFPSKNMEYMASGTPVLLTDIPSLPDEYKKYVYLAKDNSVQTLYQCIIDIMSDDAEKRQLMGCKAREFILAGKNQKIQASKIVKMVESV